jgi:hypothetical protein
MNFWKDRYFIDVEPMFGNMDRLYEPMVAEINDYPFAHESGYVRIPSKPQHDEWAKKDIWNTDYNTTIDSQWTGEWPLFDSRITLVKNTERRGLYVPGEPWEQTEPHFQRTWNILKSLPIDYFYRTIVIMGAPNCELHPHQDWKDVESPILSGQIHALFINPMNNRPFYFIDPVTKRRTYTNSSIFMLNQQITHGIAAVPYRSAIIRVFCKLNDDFCDRHGIYRANNQEQRRKKQNNDTSQRDA